MKWYKGCFDTIFVISPTFKIDSSWITAIKTGIIDPIDKKNIRKSFNIKYFTTIFKDIMKKNKGKVIYKNKFKSLFIFDDIVGDMPRGTKNNLINTFSRNHRHYGISHITLSQEYVAVPPALRKNCYGVCLYGSDNELERKAIIKNNGGSIGLNRFSRIWDEATSKRFSFLFMKPFEVDKRKKFFLNFDTVLNPFSFSNSTITELKEDNEGGGEEEDEEEDEDINVLTKMLEDMKG
jgi:hypothetical protein